MDHTAASFEGHIDDHTHTRPSLRIRKPVLLLLYCLQYAMSHEDDNTGGDLVTCVSSFHCHEPDSVPVPVADALTLTEE